ncbi:hypothetical protein tpqmel_0723 [Candidatus Gastranaerophilus sp. (ex Termes propinquus)]|nr:hypothetical protein tpqmel_0723 [Candidatus Gastranaerophilus sp. (ex Termes propinquus)]
MELKVLEPATTMTTNVGDSFSATLTNNLLVEKQMVLPQGTLVRGDIQYVRHAQRLSRTGLLTLNFDHVVTPSGRQLPIKAAPCSNLKINKDGQVTTGGNYGYAMGKTLNRSGEIVKNATLWGVDSGRELFVGGEYLLAPIGAIGGVLGGGGYLLAGSVINLIKKGDDVVINQGDQFDVLLLDALDVPVY